MVLTQKYNAWLQERALIIAWLHTQKAISGVAEGFCELCPALKNQRKELLQNMH